MADWRFAPEDRRGASCQEIEDREGLWPIAENWWRMGTRGGEVSWKWKNDRPFCDFDRAKWDFGRADWYYGMSESDFGGPESDFGRAECDYDEAKWHFDGPK